jgi:hypothetical protein
MPQATRLSHAVRALIPLAVAGLLAAGCGGETTSDAQTTAHSTPAAPSCPSDDKAEWQKLADRIDAPVYCPAWEPSPITQDITRYASYGGAGGATVSVSKDRSYLISQIWSETGTGEVHVNFRGYPGKTRIPMCTDMQINAGLTVRTPVPCFSDRRGTVTAGDIKATLYTANQGADQWHLLYAWRHDGSLYTVSQHVAEPLTFEMVQADLVKMLNNLVLVEPDQG